MTLKRQVASGFFWVALAQMTSRLLSFVTTLILARLLSPSAFGLVGTALLAIAALQYFQDIGFDAALIYRRDEIEDASHTAFWMVLASSLVIFLLTEAAAPAIARLFRQPEVTPVLRVLALAIPISSFGRVPYILLNRELDFRRRLLPELAASVLGNGTAIFLALRGSGVWSLVWGQQLLRVILATGLVWFFTTWRPRLRFSTRLARELFGYGKHIVSSQTLIFLITNVDNAVVARYAGQAALGLYSFAYNISNTPATQITSIISQVMFPTFAKLSGNAAETRARYYLTLARYVTWITVPVAFATIFFAPEFILGLYGTEWAGAVLPLQLLAVYGLIRSVAANMGSVFRAMGKPHWLTAIAAWRLAIMLLTLYPAVRFWGIVGVGALSVVVAVIDFVISATLVGKLVAAPWRAYAQMLLPSGAAALIAAGLAHRLYPFLPLPKTALNLAAAGIILGAIYAGLTWLLDRQFRETATLGWRFLWQQRRRLGGGGAA